MESHWKKVSGASFLLFYSKLPVMGGQRIAGKALPHTQMNNLLHILCPLPISDRSSRYIRPYMQKEENSCTSGGHYFNSLSSILQKKSIGQVGAS